MVELADEAVEEVALGGCVPIAVGSSALVVGFGSGGGAEGGEGPEVSGVAESVIFDVAAADVAFFAGGAGDGGGACIGFQASGAGEACAVVSDFGEDAGC